MVTNAEKLVAAVLHLQRHLDALKKLRDDCEPCEVERFGYHGPDEAEWHRGQDERAAPCWKQRVGDDGELHDSIGERVQASRFCVEH